MLTWVSRPFSHLSVSELYSILRLRAEVFVVEQNCVYLDPDNKDLAGLHLMGWDNDHLAAYSRILPAGVAYPEVSIGRVVSSPQSRRYGYGKELITESIKLITNTYGEQPIRIGAQLYLHDFYQRFGFIRQGDMYLEDGIPHVIMLRP
jgi:ElaA protein